jgi:tetratricopeptide (TPR) repeat protein
MGLFKNIFKKNNSELDSVDVRKPESQSQGTASTDKPSIKLADFVTITIENGAVGSSTGSTYHDFYVYEWFIKDTGEIFYVGKGRGDRYKEHHERAYEAENVRKMYNTDVRFVATDLSEHEALDLESKEMTRILNETNDRLTNRIIPFFTERDNGYGRSPSTPPFKFEAAPILYACEIDEHYFGIKGRPFDKVEYKNLSSVAFIDKNISREELEIVYGGNYEYYQHEVISLLEANGNKILKSKYAKSVSAWIYSSDDYVTNNDLDEKQAEERIGRKIPSYHLIDVWKLLKADFSNVETEIPKQIEIHPVNNRVPLSQIRNKNNWEKGFDDGFKYWEQGDAERKTGNIEEAIRLFDKARYNGYFAPVLYNSYAMAYRKLKDLDNEIDILTEGIERYRATREGVQMIVKLKEQRKKAIAKLQKERK